MIRLFALLAFALAPMLPLSLAASQVTPVASPPAGDTTADAAAAAAAAVEYSRLEAAGDYNGLYDRIHPDAHAVIPRAAAVGWFEDEFAARGPGIATVTGVRFAAWTWAVTGKSYPYTAIVSFTQPFADGTIDAEIVRLVQDQVGEWRWFFGRDRAFVERQIARYVPDTPLSDGINSTVDVAIADLNAFWAVSFQAAGRPYRVPNVTILDTEMDTGCGTLHPTRHPAVYCPGDTKIYYATAFFTEQETRFGDYAWVHILAHEWAHHVQYALDPVRIPSKALELQADCLAGAYARDAGTRRLLEPGDITHAVMVSAAYAANPLAPRDPGAVSGTNDERIVLFVRGYLDGFLGCQFPLAPPPESLAGAAGGVPGEPLYR